MWEWQGLEAMEVCLDSSYCSGLPGMHRLDQQPTHHSTERCESTRLHHHRQHAAHGGTEHNRHQQIATPPRVPRGGGKARFFGGIWAALWGFLWKKGLEIAQLAPAHPLGNHFWREAPVITRSIKSHSCDALPPQLWAVRLRLFKSEPVQ